MLKADAAPTMVHSFWSNFSAPGKENLNPIEGNVPAVSVTVTVRVPPCHGTSLVCYSESVTVQTTESPWTPVGHGRSMTNKPLAGGRVAGGRGPALNGRWRVDWSGIRVPESDRGSLLLEWEW